jgi:transcription-repair coupling factor (superfamily II helicase)
MRLIARKLGVEKIILKNRSLILQFTSKKEYYNSEVFGKVLQFIQANRSGEMKQKNDKLNIVFKPVNTVHESLKLLNEM